MKIRVQHRTEYVYSQPVRNNSNELRLQPPNTLWQKREFFLLKILPATRPRRYTDFYRNLVSHFEVEEPHARLTIETTSTVSTRNPYEAGEPFGVPFSRLREAREIDEAAPFFADSRYVKITPEVWRAALDTVDGCDDAFEAATRIMRHVHDTCRYRTGVTGVGTTSEEFFATREGVCQDFAHLMLAMCRAAGIPARYVSGYLFDQRRGHLRGAHESHAWVEVFLPGSGWHGLDPTNRRLVDDLYVFLAAGRDYDDAAPVRGSFFGGATRRLEVSVSVNAL